MASMPLSCSVSRYSSSKNRCTASTSIDYCSHGARRPWRSTPDEYEKYLKRAYKNDDLPDKPRNIIGLKKSLEPDEMRSLMETNVPVDGTALRDVAMLTRCSFTFDSEPV